MDLAILKAELEKLDYALLDDAAAAAELNKKDIATSHPVNRILIKNLKLFTMTVPIVMVSGGEVNLWYIIEAKSLAGVPPFKILWGLFQDDTFQSIDFSGFQAAMLNAGLDNLVADNNLVFDEAAKTALTAQIMGLVEVEYSSIADGLGLGTVTELDVNRARYSYGN